MNSQLSKNSVAVSHIQGLKTPLISDKSKKHQFAMTPDIHTKTYAERSGLGGIGSTGFAGYVNSGGTSLNAT